MFIYSIYLADIKREMKRLVITEPPVKQKTFIAGPAMFGPQLGGEMRYQVRVV